MDRKTCLTWKLGFVQILFIISFSNCQRSLTCVHGAHYFDENNFMLSNHSVSIFVYDRGWNPSNSMTIYFLLRDSYTILYEQICLSTSRWMKWMCFARVSFFAAKCSLKNEGKLELLRVAYHTDSVQNEFWSLKDVKIC